MTREGGPETYESREAALVTRNRTLLAIAASPLLLTIPSILAGVLVSPRFFGATILSLIVGGLLGALTLLVNPFARRHAPGITADAKGLSTRTGVTIAREDLAQGLVVPTRRGGWQVSLSRKGASLPVAVDVPSRDDGARLLRALGLDAAHSVASFFGMSKVYASAGRFFANMALFIGGPAVLGVLSANLHFWPLGVMAALVGIFAYVSFFMPMRIRIGGDGLVVSWYGRKRFLPYADIELMTRVDRLFGTSKIRGVLLRTRAGEEIWVPLGYGIWDSGRTGIVEERIREAMESYARGEPTSEAAELARGDRPVADWILALRRIGTGANAGPRTAAIARDVLFRIVDSAGAKPSARAAAAVALAAGLDEDERARLRSVAEGTTAPKLRIALEAASGEEDEAAVAEALEAVEAEERAAER